MKYFYIYCEGPTEERFINEVLKRYFEPKFIFVEPIILTTGRKGNKVFKGGTAPYYLMKKEIKNLCGNRNIFITTMLDYYGLGTDVPGRKEPIGSSIYEKADYIEKKLKEDISESNFIPNLLIHEFEALLFCEPSKFYNVNEKKEYIKEIYRIKNCFDTPEHINDNVATSPSKRILKIYPEYKKIQHGPIIAKDIGMECILNQCKHFAKWINKLEEISI